MTVNKGDSTSATGGEGAEAHEELRRFGYYTSNPNGTFDFRVSSKPADAAVVAELRTLVKVVFHLQPIVIALEGVLRNRADLIGFVGAYRAQLNAAATPHVRVEAALEGLIAATQRTTNLLSAATAFLAMTEAALRDAYGESSAELVAWNTRRRELHAASFAYRFLYELRNFAQHRALPVSSFNIFGERPSEGLPMVFQPNVRLIRDALLVAGFDWGKLQAELEQQPAQFDLLPLIDEYVASLQALCLDVFMLEGARLAQCVLYMDAIKRTLQVPEGAIPVVFVGESASPHQPPGNVEIIPGEQLRWLIRRFDELMNFVRPPGPRTS